MIPVPRPVLEALALRYRAAPDTLAHFGGGRPESDGIVYAYPSGEGRRMLKVIAIPLEGASRAMRCFDERLRFTHYLGTHGARIAHPLPSPAGNLYETSEHGAHRWVAYAMDVAPGTVVRPDAWIPALFRDWGRTIGLLHRLARAYPSWHGAVDPETGEEYLTWREEWQGFYSGCPDGAVRTAWAAIRKRLEALPVERDAFGMTHNDPHLFNLLYDARAGVTLLDFDVANHHWLVHQRHRHRHPDDPLCPVRRPGSPAGAPGKAAWVPRALYGGLSPRARPGLRVAGPPRPVHRLSPHSPVHRDVR